MLKSFKKIIRVVPEILAFVGFGQNRAKITHLTQKGIFGRFQLCYFHLAIMPYHTAEFQKSLST